MLSATAIINIRFVINSMSGGETGARFPDIFWEENEIDVNLRPVQRNFISNMVAVAQLVRASDCGSEGRGFEPHHPPKASHT